MGRCCAVWRYSADWLAGAGAGISSFAEGAGVPVGVAGASGVGSLVCSVLSGWLSSSVSSGAGVDGSGLATCSAGGVWASSVSSGAAGADTAGALAALPCCGAPWLL
jgi:hypothetical protein